MIVACVACFVAGLGFGVAAAALIVRRPVTEAEALAKAVRRWSGVTRIDPERVGA